LLNYVVPDVVQDIRPEHAALYALSVGFGQDPLDIRELAFVDPAQSIAVVPSMALVMGYPGFWLGAADLGLDSAKIVHVEQQVELHRPLQIPARIMGRTRVTGLFSRGVGRGLVLNSERQLTDESDGARIATLRQVHFLLGDECADAPPFLAGSRPVDADMLADVRLDLPTRPEQALLYRLNGDRNPLHSDPSVAAAAGFPRPILHGMCTFGVVTRAVMSAMVAYRPELIGGLSMRFRAPVFPGETVRVEIWPDGNIRVHVLDRNALVIDHGQVTFVGGDGTIVAQGVRGDVEMVAQAKAPELA